MLINEVIKNLNDEEIDQDDDLNEFASMGGMSAGAVATVTPPAPAKSKKKKKKTDENLGDTIIRR